MRRAITSAVFSQKGPPEAVRIREAMRSGGSPTRHWKSALCSESTGTISAPVRLAAATSNSPAATINSLLATAMRLPRSTAANTASKATAPSVAASKTSGFDSTATASKPSAPESTRVPEGSAARRAAAPSSMRARDPVGPEATRLVEQFVDTGAGGEPATRKRSG